MEQLNRAVQWIIDGEVEKGLNQLKAIQSSATHEQLFEIAELYYELGLINEANDVIKKLKLVFPGDAELLIFEAELLVELNQTEEAMLVLEGISEDSVGFAQSQLLLADLYYMDGLVEVSEQKLLKAKASMPDEIIVDLALAEFYLSQGDFSKCLPYYQTIIKKTNQLNDINIPLRIADVLSKTGRFEEALEYYEEGLTLKKDPDALFSYGITALSAKENRKAIKAFRDLENIDASYATLYPNLAKALENEGAIDEAYQACQNGLKVDKFNEELYVDTAKIAVKLLNWEEGEHFLREAISINPSYIEAVLMLIGLLKDQERYEEIIELIIHIEGFDEEVPQYHWHLATAYKELEKFDESLKQYEIAYNYFENDNEFLEEYAYFLREEGKRVEAKKLFEKILKNDPTSVHIEEILWEFDEY